MSERLTFSQKLIDRVRNLRDKHFLRVPPRDKEPFVTHLPVLIGVGHLVQARRILELGSGNYSSLTFLDRDCFPLVEHVDSFENDSDWGSKIQAKAAHDPRFHMHLLEGAVADAIGAIKLEEYDMVFIDDSITSNQRCATIREVVRRLPSRPVVVIHDFEHAPYRTAVRGMTKIVRITALNPNTGVAWNKTQLAKASLRRLNEHIRACGKGLPLGNPAELARSIRGCLGPVSLV